LTERAATAADNPTILARLRAAWRAGMMRDVDRDRVLRLIAEESGWSPRYALMIVISVGISLLGLLMPSVAVLIGAMLISPLMMPIIGLGFAIAMLDFAEIRRTGFALAAGAIIAVALSALFVTVSPVQTITAEIAARTRPTLFDLLVALLSAVAGGYALIRGRGGTVVGVAIAIALMPPLAVVGFGIATANGTVFAGALLLFFTNLITIALTAAVMARLYGFGSHLSPSHTGGQMLLFVVALSALAVPLGSALKQIAFEAVAQRQARDAVIGQFPQPARLSQLEVDHDARPLRIRAVVLTPALHPDADRIVGGTLVDRWGQPVDLHIDQIRTSERSGQTEAAQIAKASDRGDGRTVSDGVAERVALVAGVDPATVAVDPAARTLSVVAASLPGLELGGYRALERRAAAAVPGWAVALQPPEEARALPEIGFVEGVADVAAISDAAWISDRLKAQISISGGTARRRQAVSAAIVAQGGQADTTDLGGGSVTLRWAD